MGERYLYRLQGGDVGEYYFSYDDASLKNRLLGFVPWFSGELVLRCQDGALYGYPQQFSLRGISPRDAEPLAEISGITWGELLVGYRGVLTDRTLASIAQQVSPSDMLCCMSGRRRGLQRPYLRSLAPFSPPEWGDVFFVGESEQDIMALYTYGREWRHARLRVGQVDMPFVVLATEFEGSIRSAIACTLNVSRLRIELLTTPRWEEVNLR